MRAIPHRWLVLLAMTGSLSMVMLDQTVVAVALPTMGRDLDLSPTGITWVINAYTLAMAALVALGGALGDRLGRVTAFRLGVVIFVVASALCGLAPTTAWGEAWIIGARALQGAGAALMMPASAAIVIDAFAPRERGRAMAVYAGCSQLFLALGPLVGGILTEAVSWRAVFWLNAPVGLASLALVRLAKPRNEPQSGTRMSVTSLGLLIGGLTATVLAIQQANTWSWTAPVTWLTLAVGLAMTTTFVVRQLRSSQPLVNVRLLAKGAFAGNVIVLTLVQFALVALVLFNSLYAQDILGFHPLAAGVAALPLIVALALTAQAGGRWFDRSGVRPPVLSGLTLTVVGVGAWAATLPSLSYPHQVPGMILTGIGIGLIMSPTNTDALSRIAPTDRGQASGLLQTARQIGGTLGVAVIGAVVLAILHDGTGSPSLQHGADAVTVGFSCAAVALVGALAAGWLLLPRERLTGTGADEKIDALATTNSSR